jgi:hypothetical protein
MRLSLIASPLLVTAAANMKHAEGGSIYCAAATPIGTARPLAIARGGGGAAGGRRRRRAASRTRPTAMPCAWRLCAAAAAHRSRPQPSQLSMRYIRMRDAAAAQPREWRLLMGRRRIAPGLLGGHNLIPGSARAHTYLVRYSNTGSRPCRLTEGIERAQRAQEI